jgi:hypothetical protein
MVIIPNGYLGSSENAATFFFISGDEVFFLSILLIDRVITY